jgi:predicted RNA binding protein YcfA (HicA-like mRNA interferase family)
VKLPRALSGRRLAEVLCRHFDYREVHQVGSHIVLETDEPSRQRLTIPAHASLRIGTLASILRMVAHHKGIQRDRILQRL